ncbi:TRAP transporter permease [Polymorphum gilvum]|uniref:TRAP transporter, 4TM/12TM fusion protein n=1 Tax=Polymorphum gilvum (strain LMG 25793 / CGMCC 1.9160 / SL003B-26A1) TaxID=991905 RepID=F2J6A2_POLGS|nr:TRAP transporter fused permease subunit [Polymorphum gilvum]ADZ71276.1 TRAP transporter, 4TM/12TM fusion protein [Polymorphum gilvum SL003B-26A1]
MATIWKLLPEGHLGRLEHRLLCIVVSLLAVAATFLVVHSAWFGSLTALLLRSAFFSLMTSAGLFLVAARMHWRAWRLALYVLAILVLIPGPYLQANFMAIIRSGGIAGEMDVRLFVLSTVAVFVLARYTIGWSMVVIGVAALAYAFWGNHIPGVYGHAGYSLGRVTSNLFLSTEGLFGLPMGVAAQYILLFSLLGALLLRSGLGQVFVDLAHALTGRIQGGPALTAVVSSTMFSSINGSAVAGVVTTGTFTIPLMKRTGYRPKVAGAIEAAASSAGQIMPPVMGAAAFLMAEVTRTPYATIAAAALIPALLYVFALLVAVRLEAGKFNMSRSDGSDVPTVRSVLAGRGYMLLPLVALVGFLIYGYTPAKAAVLCIAATLAISLLSAKTRMGPAVLVEVMVETLRNVLPVVAAVAVAGILIGVLTLTGMALKVSAMILDFGGDSLFLVLVLTMIASFVLGLGMPTSAAYLLLAILIAPALVKFGLPVIAAHMFIFYYGLLSAITPPVALAAYAGASIAGAQPNETAVEAMRLGFVKVVAPFLFVYSPGLLLIGTPLDIVMATIGAVGATFAAGTAMVGWCIRPMSLAGRLAYWAAAVLFTYSLVIDQAAVLSFAAKAAGLVLIAIPLWNSWRTHDNRSADLAS